MGKKIIKPLKICRTCNGPMWWLCVIYYAMKPRCAIYSKPISTKIFAVILSLWVCEIEFQNWVTGVQRRWQLSWDWNEEREQPCGVQREEPSRQGGSRCKGPGARGVSQAWSRQRKPVVCLMLGEQKEWQRASEAMEKSLDAVLSIN